MKNEETVASGVRLPKSTILKLKQNKQSTGISIGFFVNEAILEKLERENKKNAGKKEAV